MCCFEGMKAYHGADGRMRLFRPDQNMARLLRSARRLQLADFDPEVRCNTMKPASGVRPLQPPWELVACLPTWRCDSKDKAPWCALRLPRLSAFPACRHAWLLPRPQELRGCLMQLLFALTVNCCFLRCRSCLPA